MREKRGRVERLGVAGGRRRRDRKEDLGRG